MKPKLLDYLHLHFLVVIWGFTAILGLLLDPLNAPAVVAYRTLLASIGLGLVLFFRKNGGFAVAASDRWRLLATGAIIGLHWLAFFGAARLANASVCLAGMATGSIWTSLLEPLLLRRRVRPVEVILGIVVMIGLYLIFRFAFDKVLGLSVAIFSAMLAALFTIINSRFAQRIPALTMSFYEMTGAFLTSGLFLLVFYVTVIQDTGSVNNGSVNQQFVPIFASQWLWLTVLAGVCTVYAYTASMSLLRKFSPFAVNLTVNLEPVYGILLAVLIFKDKERMTPGFYIGTLVILAAVLAYPIIMKSGKPTAAHTD
ncbi:DMT family transporter [Arsenicibacter rosenii]|uniref:EamA family transporter n=1 Tax=Arsenicibacter rosenii TaxID=1750698 RepID=A0A1S2VKW8_9BACT|nr:DMT family transporter [Arsenicibacter rosenii]OIN58846.1 EamA family transporter [Arsenicibacter rosenii]